MKTFPVKKENGPVQQPEKPKNADVVDPCDPLNPYFDFRYVYKSMTFFNGRTCIKAKENRFINGKFETEEIEGTLGGEIYQHAVTEFSNAWSNMMSSLITSMFHFHRFFPVDSRNKHIK